MQRWFFLLLFLMTVRLAWGQSAAPQDLRELLYGDTASRPAALKDLDSGWRRITVHRPPEKNPGGLMGLFGSLFSALGDEAVYYTQGKMLEVGGATYLIAYRVKPKPLDMKALMALSEKPMPDASGVMGLLLPKRTPESPLSLALLDVRAIGDIHDIRAFDLNQELKEVDASTLAAQTAIQAAILFPVFAQARMKARATSSLSNLKQMALGALMYAQDHDEVFPTMKDAASVKKALMPYVRNETIFLDPQTRSPYGFNPALSHKSLAALAEPAEVVLFYETGPGQDNKRGVVFADGHAKRIPEADWAAVKKKSGIP